MGTIGLFVEAMLGCGAGNGPDLDGLGAGSARNPSQFAQGAAGGDDIVEQGDVARKAALNHEGAIEIVLTISGAEADLRWGCAHPAGRVGQNRHAESRCEGAQEFQRLVVAALAQALRMQRHRDHCCRQRLLARLYGIDPALTEQASGRQTVVEFELAQQVVYRCGIGEGDAGVLPRRRVALAMAADLPAGIGLAAARTGGCGIDIWPGGRTIRTDELVILSRLAAEHTGRWQQHAPHLLQRLSQGLLPGAAEFG